jgi:glycine/D-amino acid oxidase-like deaminating enzyme
MNVIVLGDSMVGVTTAYYLLEHGHEGTLIERRPGVARACSHANGGFVAIGRAVHCGDRPCDRFGRHEQPPNHGAPPTLVVPIAATSPEPDDDVDRGIARGWASRWLWRMR